MKFCRLPPASRRKISYEEKQGCGSALRTTSMWIRIQVSLECGYGSKFSLQCESGFGFCSSSCDHSILSVHGPPRLHCEPLKLLSFAVNAEPDQDFDSNADPVPASQNNADTDRQPCRKVRLTYSTYSPKYIPVLKMDTTVEMKGTPMSSFRNFPKHLTITRKPIFSFLYIAHR